MSESDATDVDFPVAAEIDAGTKLLTQFTLWGAAWFLFGSALTFVLLIATSSIALASDRYFDGAMQGWFWYQDPAPEAEDKPEEPAPAAALEQVVSARPDPRQVLDAQREALELAMAQAVLEPTPEHIRAYLELNQALLAQSGTFADAWQRIVWSTPALDYSLASPTGSAAYIQADERAVEQSMRLAAAAQRYGLVFIFQSTCGFCQQFSPVLKAFADQHGFEVIPVTVDGEGLPEFPDPRPNFSIAQVLEVEEVPAVYLLDADSRTVVPAAFGFMGYTDLVQRVTAAIEAIEGGVPTHAQVGGAS